MTIILVVLQIELASSHLKSLKVHAFMKFISLALRGGESSIDSTKCFFEGTSKSEIAIYQAKSGKKMPRGMFANFLRLSSEFIANDSL